MTYKHGNLMLSFDMQGDVSRYIFVSDNYNERPCLIESDDTLVIFDESKQKIITVIKVVLDLSNNWQINGTDKLVHGRQKGFDLEKWITLFECEHPAVLITRNTDELEVKKIVLSLLDSEKNLKSN